MWIWEENVIRLYMKLNFFRVYSRRSRLRLEEIKTDVTNVGAEHAAEKEKGLERIELKEHE